MNNLSLPKHLASRLTLAMALGFCALAAQAGVSTLTSATVHPKAITKSGQLTVTVNGAWELASKGCEIHVSLFQKGGIPLYEMGNHIVKGFPGTFTANPVAAPGEYYLHLVGKTMPDVPADVASPCNGAADVSFTTVDTTISPNKIPKLVNPH